MTIELPVAYFDCRDWIVKMCTGDGDVPLYLRVADGNESDRRMATIRELKGHTP
jgi:hypothetical protein